MMLVGSGAFQNQIRFCVNNQTHSRILREKNDSEYFNLQLIICSNCAAEVWTDRQIHKRFLIF